MLDKQANPLSSPSPVKSDQFVNTASFSSIGFFSYSGRAERLRREGTGVPILASSSLPNTSSTVGRSILSAVPVLLSYHRLFTLPVVSDGTSPRRLGGRQARISRTRDPGSRSSSSMSSASLSNWMSVSDEGVAENWCTERMDRTSRHAQRVVKV